MSHVEFRNGLRLVHDPLCINVIMVCHAPLLKYIPFLLMILIYYCSGRNLCDMLNRELAKLCL